MKKHLIKIRSWSMDRVTYDLNKYLDEQEKAIEIEEQEELEIRKDRISYAMIVLASSDDDIKKARRLASWVEQEVEEFKSNY
tara:strand:+ start:476 stop:721 length:246 start_codon:yes stop_codon:yes gene_type:complete